MTGPRRVVGGVFGRRGVAVLVGVSLFGGDFGDGGSRGGLVDDGFAGGVGGDEGLNGDVVDGAGGAAADLVDQRGRVVAEERVGAAGEGEVAGRFGGVHRGECVAQRDALVEGGEGAQLDPAAQGGLADQQAVLPAPTSPVTTPRARSLMHQEIRATASAWAVCRCSMPGAKARPKGIRVKP